MRRLCAGSAAKPPGAPWPPASGRFQPSASPPSRLGPAAQAPRPAAGRHARRPAGRQPGGCRPAGRYRPRCIADAPGTGSGGRGTARRGSCRGERVARLGRRGLAEQPLRLRHRGEQAGPAGAPWRVRPQPSHFVPARPHHRMGWREAHDGAVDPAGLLEGVKQVAVRQPARQADDVGIDPSSAMAPQQLVAKQVRENRDAAPPGAARQQEDLGPVHDFGRVASLGAARDFERRIVGVEPVCAPVVEKGPHAELLIRRQRAAKPERLDDHSVRVRRRREGSLRSKGAIAQA